MAVGKGWRVSCLVSFWVSFLDAHAYLFIFETQQYNFVHQCELRLLASFGTFANIARIERYLMAILAVFVARLGAIVARAG